MKLSKWYSPEMKFHHEKCKTKKYKVYHFYYTGITKGWHSKSPRWGYIGVCPYEKPEDVVRRYEIELREWLNGVRPYKRFMIDMFNRYWSKKMNLQILHEDLSRSEALEIENFYRPEGHTMYKDKRIWNEIAGG